MKEYHGTASSSGVAIGKALVIYSSFANFPHVELDSEEEVEEEIKRLRIAQKKTEEQIDATEGRSAAVLADEMKPIFSTYKLFLRDKRLVPATETKVQELKINAEWALSQTIETLKEQFNRLPDPYLKSRFNDIRQIGERIMGNLQNKPRLNLDRLKEPVILLTHDISPEDAFHLANGKILGLVTELGGETSHTSIIARAMGIPAVIGLDGITFRIKSKDQVIIDGDTGEVLQDPDESAAKKKAAKQRRQKKFKDELEELTYTDCTLANGAHVNLAANLDFIGELKELRALNISAIGLIRTEFLFIQNNQPPKETEQYELFKHILEENSYKPITIRTWDIGADKTSKFFPAFDEANPALGLRAIRMCLKFEDILREQIRAIVRVSSLGAVKIMIPMVTNVDEMIRSKELIREEQEALGVSPDNLAIGCMIETPAAAMIVDELIDICDFISIGSNDLVQYTLAIDRMNEHVSHMYLPFHPAILKMLEMIVTKANKADVSVSICGEMAADPYMQIFLLGVGNITFSMTPNKILSTKRFLQKVELIDCKKIAFRFLSKHTLKESSAYLSQLRETYANEALGE